MKNLKSLCVLVPALMSVVCSHQVSADQLKDQLIKSALNGRGQGEPPRDAVQSGANQSQQQHGPEEANKFNIFRYLGSKLKPQTTLARLIYDDFYIANLLDERYPYLKQDNGTYLGIRDYFDFDQVFWPSDEHLANVNVEQALYEEMRAFETTASQASLDIWHYSDEEELEQSGGHLRDPEKCRRSMSELMGELELAQKESGRLFEPGRKNIELLRWIDSWGRPESETYLGNAFWVGSYRGCRGVSLQLNTSVPQATRFNYCWAKVAPRDWPQDDVMRPRMSIRVGVCLPDSCDTIEARKLGPTILKMMQFNFSPMHKERFQRLLDIYCLPLPSVDDTSFLGRLSVGARVFLALTLAWLLLIGASSLWYQGTRTTTSDGSGSWLRLITVQENYRQFVRSDAPPAESRIDLRALGLPRLMASVMVATAHCFVQNYYSFHSTNVLLVESRKYHYLLFSLLWKSVDMFFVLSGILTSYSIMAKFAPKRQMHLIIKPKIYLLLNLTRYLRIAPLMMFCWAFVKTTYAHLSEGPYWDYGTYQNTFLGRCKRISWWRSLIWPIILDYKGYTGDPYQHECISVSWYIVTDLKMFLVVPFYVYIIYTRPRWRWPVLGLTLAISTGWKLAHFHLQQLIHLRQIFSYGEMHALHILISFLDSSYYSAVDRFQAIAVGLSAGLYLYKYKLNRIRQWPWWMRGKAIWCLVAWLVYDAFRRIIDEIHYRHTGEIPSDDYIRLWLVLRPRLDAIIIAILSLRLCTDWAPALMRHLLVFYKLSKLSYGVYVVHMLFILYAVNSHEHGRPDTVALQLVMLAIFVNFASFLIAFPLYLFVESPLTLLTNHLMLGKRRLMMMNKKNKKNQLQHEQQVPVVGGDVTSPDLAALQAASSDDSDGSASNHQARSGRQRVPTKLKKKKIN